MAMATATNMSTRRHRPLRSVSLTDKLDLDSAFFWLLLAFLITTFTFLSLRDHHSLDPAQLAEYERRTQTLSNSTVYIVEATRPETLLSKLKAEEWRRIGRDIDLVAIVFDDLPLFLTDDWIATAERTMDTQRLQIGIFRCGCILPSRYFELTDIRMDGYECVLLPGFVLDDSDVKWMDIDEGKECRGRDAVLSTRGTSRRWKGELAQIKHILAQEMEKRNATNTPLASSALENPGGDGTKRLIPVAVVDTRDFHAV